MTLAEAASRYCHAVENLRHAKRPAQRCLYMSDPEPTYMGAPGTEACDPADPAEEACDACRDARERGAELRDARRAKKAALAALMRTWKAAGNPPAVPDGSGRAQGGAT